MKLIDKDALVAWLKKQIRDYWSDSENTMGIYPYALEEVIKYTDSLEVKEVDLDKEHHLWTIQDAKGGDVLCDYCEGYDNPLIFILKKFERVDFGLVKPSDYSSYCFLTASDRQIFKEGKYHHKHNIKPATREQCNLLFQKMHDAGYEWDAEKKELKKIKQKLDNTWKPSEEQMDALYTYIYNPQYFNSQDPRMELVESVYNDLKKLRGK